MHDVVPVRVSRCAEGGSRLASSTPSGVARRSFASTGGCGSKHSMQTERHHRTHSAGSGGSIIVRCRWVIAEGRGEQRGQWVPMTVPLLTRCVDPPPSSKRRLRSAQQGIAQARDACAPQTAAPRGSSLRSRGVPRRRQAAKARRVSLQMPSATRMQGAAVDPPSSNRRPSCAERHRMSLPNFCASSRGAERVGDGRAPRATMPPSSQSCRVSLQTPSATRMQGGA